MRLGDGCGPGERVEWGGAPFLVGESGRGVAAGKGKAPAGGSGLVGLVGGGEPSGFAEDFDDAVALDGAVVA